MLSRKGGGLAKMLTPFRLGVGGVIGSGRQYFSWIALDDLVRVIQFALNAAALSGPVNAVAPEPVTNREFTKTLGRVLGRPTIFPDAGLRRPTGLRRNGRRNAPRRRSRRTALRFAALGSSSAIRNSNRRCGTSWRT